MIKRGLCFAPDPSELLLAFVKGPNIPDVGVYVGAILRKDPVVLFSAWVLLLVKPRDANDRIERDLDGVLKSVRDSVSLVSVSRDILRRSV